MQAVFQPQFKVVTFGLSLPQGGEGTDNEWKQAEEKDWEKAREALGGRSRENKETHVVPAPTNLRAFEAEKVTDPGVDFVYFQ